MNPILTTQEWEKLGGLLEPTSSAYNKEALASAQACLYRFNTRHSEQYRTFGWNQLPESFGISGKTANRRFRGWVNSGAWYSFWDALIEFRFGKAKPEAPARVPKDGMHPLLAAMNELQRAYRFFNTRFFGGELPRNVLITIEGPQNSPRGRLKGYFSLEGWQIHQGDFHHIALLKSVVTDSADSALQTLLHEIVHLRNFSLGLDDTDARRQYHTQDFRDVARLVGLECSTRDVRWGYALTSLGPRAKMAIRALKPAAHLFTHAA